MTIRNVQGFFAVQLPTAQVRNPVTGTDWEGVGVLPHIEAPAPDAVLAAHIDALRSLETTTQDPAQVAQLRWVSDAVAAKMHPAEHPS